MNQSEQLKLIQFLSQDETKLSIFLSYLEGVLNTLGKDRYGEDHYFDEVVKQAMNIVNDVSN